MKNRRNILEIFNGIVFALTLLGANILSLVQLSLSKTTMILVSLGLFTVYCVLAFAKPRSRIHFLEEGSKAFVKFFERWYSQNGRLSIFCMDLYWLDNQASTRVVSALRQKGPRLSLYLRDTSGPIVDTLRASGAEVNMIREGIKTRHRLSILENEGDKKILVRNTDIETRKVSFVERDNLGDPYLIGLAEDLLDDCSEEA